MTTPTMPDEDAPDQIAELRRRLSEAEETLRAIRSGEVDAITPNFDSLPDALTRKVRKPVGFAMAA